MASTFHCSIITPSGVIFDDDVEYVSLPAWDGCQGIIHGQSPFLSRLGMDLLRIDIQGSQHWYMIDGGFAQMQDNELSILTEHTLRPGDVTMEEAREECEAANEGARAGGAGQADAEAAQARGRAKVALASMSAS